MTEGWRRERLLGQGAFARVYLLREERGGRLLACKVAESAEAQAVLRREAEVLRSVRHALFPGYVDFQQEENRAMLLMEYVEGESLSALLAREGALPQAQAARIAAALAEGLRYLHELPRPMLYRDLKPDNILVRANGSVKLVDLGCACAVGEARYSRAGSRGYAAPEQMGGDPAKGVRKTANGTFNTADSAGNPANGDASVPPGAYSDVYALGRLLHYLLTGQNPCQPPFCKQPVRAYDPSLSPLMESLVEQCVAEEPERRLPDMRSVLRGLAPFLEPEKSWKFRLRERRAKVRGRLPGGRRSGDFLYEKSVCRISEQ